MSNSDDEPRGVRDAEPLRYRLVRLLGNMEPGAAGFVFVWLAFFPPALALVGFAASFELTSSWWLTLPGVGLGLCTGVALARDFLRWRVSLVGLLLAAAFATLFLLAYF